MYWNNNSILSLSDFGILSHCHMHCLAAILSHCLTVLLSYCHTVLLSYCHTVLLSYCHTVLLSYCHTVLLSYCHTVILSYRQLNLRRPFPVWWVICPSDWSNIPPTKKQQRDWSWETYRLQDTLSVGNFISGSSRSSISAWLIIYLLLWVYFSLASCYLYILCVRTHMNLYKKYMNKKNNAST